MAEGDEPYVTPIPESLFPLVQIRHPNPQYSLAFEKLGLRWVPAPALSQLGFDIGGVQYTATPFIGWFMDAEIGVHNLADSFRYNVLPSIVSALKLLQPGQELDELPQWERLALLSRAQTELNFAVHWSFMDSGVRMSDTLTASAMYTNFDDQHLAKHGFRLPADPYWLAPPQGSIVPVWHRGGAPNYQPKPMICRLKESPIKVWKRLRAERDGAASRPNGDNRANDICHVKGRVEPFNDKMLAHTVLTSLHTSTPIIRVFFCSSGTTAQRLAIKLEQRLHIIMDQASSGLSIAPATPLNEFQPNAVSTGDLIFIIASSAGRGDVPTNGQIMLQKCSALAKIEASNVTFCIFGNGNSSYAANCNGAAFKLEAAMRRLGFSSAMPLFQADTLKEDPPWRQFKTWMAYLEAKYGRHAENIDDISSEQDENSTGLLLAQLSPVKVISVHAPKYGDIRRLALDVGRLEYSHMSHVDVFVPLGEDEIDELLLMARLTGEELLTFEEGQVSTRQLFSLVDPDKPFTNIKWAANLGLNLTSEEEARLMEQSMRSSIKDLPVGWQAKAKRGSLAGFMMALPTRRSRTFSTASSQLYWNLQNMGNVLELTLQTHPGGLFTDHFLSKARRGERLFVRIRHGPGAHLVNDTKPLIAFTTGSGIAPLRGLLQARSAIAADRPAGSKMTDLTMGKTSRGDSISLFLGFKPGDADIIAETTHEALALELVDMLHMTPSNPERSRAQDKIFKEGIANQIRTKIRDQGASVFVCASKEAADDFAQNLEAIVGVNSIREVLGERWIEEVYVCTEV